MQLTLVNHACVKIRCEQTVLLCDPWLGGSAFNDGWDLLIPTPLSVPEVMADVTHIWVSHEHPDHFSIKFFGDIAAYRDKITVLFQKTRDRRVYNALTGKGFKVREITPDESVVLDGGVTLRLGLNEFYDSWMWLSDGKSTLLNMNDCVTTTPAELAAVKSIASNADVLLTQFSYAAWKGGRENTDFREAAAKQKLDTIALQIAELKPKAVVPFASLAYFSSTENAYLNDRVNTPVDAAGCIATAGANAVVLFPGDSWTIGAPHENAPAFTRYVAAYAGRDALPKREPGASVAMPELATLFAKYQQKMFVKNSKLMVRLARHVPLLGAFQPVKIGLTDLHEGASVSLTDGFKPVPYSECEVFMHSRSLAFIFGNEFGYDTLTVNGRFEATSSAFSRMTRSLSLGSLNAMGLSVSPALVLQSNVVLLLLRRLMRVVARLRGAPANEAA